MIIHPVRSEMARKRLPFLLVRMVGYSQLVSVVLDSLLSIPARGAKYLAAV